MTARSINGWEEAYAELRRRLVSGRWKAGELLPPEADIAAEFGCARGTVNRALQAIADEGLLERRRRGGTRVVVHPERKATISIPLIRHDVEQQGRVHGYRLVERRRVQAPARVRERMGSGVEASFLHVRALHTADGRPYVLEDRWIDVSVVPAAAEADFTERSPNEWLVENVPFRGGDLVASAAAARPAEARVLECERGAAVFVIERRTRDGAARVITAVRLVFAPGHTMELQL